LFWVPMRGGACTVVELGRSGSEKMVKLRVRRRTQVSDSSCCEGALSMRITHQSLRYYDSTTLYYCDARTLSSLADKLPRHHLITVCLALPDVMNPLLHMQRFDLDAARSDSSSRRFAYLWRTACLVGLHALGYQHFSPCIGMPLVGYAPYVLSM